MVEVLGPGEPLVEQLCIHERFGDVSDEVCILIDHGVQVNSHWSFNNTIPFYYVDLLRWDV